MKLRAAYLALAALPLAVAACQPAPAVTPAPAPVATTAEEVIAAMHDRYDDTWYRTLRFRQKVIHTPPDGSSRPNEVWLEHAEIPGKLRIDLGENFTGAGNIYSGDSIFIFNPGRAVVRRAGRNPLMVLGFDVYRQPVEESLRVLRTQKFDFTKFRIDTWQGRPHYVIGATDASDLRSPQFWIEQDRLVFTRLITPAGQAGMTEIRFDSYEKLGGGWIAPVVVFLRDGKEFMREEYFDMEANVSIPEGLFNPDMWDKIKPK